MKKGLLFFVFIFISLQVTAQKKNFYLHGIVRDSVNLIKNVHVVNLNRSKGTFSNDYGQYRIVASLGDTIEFTSVQYETVTAIITDRIAFSEKLNVIIQKKTYELDEIVLKNHDLTGNLLTDRKQVPKDSIAKVGKNISQVIIDLAENTTGFNEISAKEKSAIGGIDKKTDPTKKFNGVGGSVGLGIGSGKRKKAKLLKITSNTFTTQNIIDTVDTDFFTKIKIPEKHIYQFIDYCKRFNIRKLYEDKKTLEIMKLFKEKAPLYLKLIK